MPPNEKIKRQVAKAIQEKMVKYLSAMRRQDSQPNTFLGVVDRDNKTITAPNGQVYNAKPLGNPTNRVDAAIPLNSTDAVYLDEWTKHNRRELNQVRPLMVGRVIYRPTSTSGPSGDRPVLYDLEKGEIRVIPIPEYTSTVSGRTLLELIEFNARAGGAGLDVRNGSFSLQSTLSEDGKHLAFWITSGESINAYGTHERIDHLAEVIYVIYKNISFSGDEEVDLGISGKMKLLKYRSAEVGAVVFDSEFRSQLGIDVLGTPIEQDFGDLIPPGTAMEFLAYDASVGLTEYTLDNTSVGAVGSLSRQGKLSLAIPIINRQILIATHLGHVHAGYGGGGGGVIGDDNKPFQINYWVCPNHDGGPNTYWDLGGIGAGFNILKCADGWFEILLIYPSAGFPEECAAYVPVLNPDFPGQAGDHVPLSATTTRVFVNVDLMLLPNVQQPDKTSIIPLVHFEGAMVNPRPLTNYTQHGCPIEQEYQYDISNSVEQFVEGIDLSEWFSTEKFDILGPPYQDSTFFGDSSTSMHRGGPTEDGSYQLHIVTSISSSAARLKTGNTPIIRIDATISEEDVCTSYSAKGIFVQSDRSVIQGGDTFTIVNANSKLIVPHEVLQGSHITYVGKGVFRWMTDLVAQGDQLKAKIKSIRLKNEEFNSNAFIEGDLIQFELLETKNVSYKLPGQLRIGTDTIFTDPKIFSIQVGQNRAPKFLLWPGRTPLNGPYSRVSEGRFLLP